jgi:hypothetical protein
MRTLRILVAVACVWIGFTRSAFAEPIAIAFTATVSDVVIGSSLLAPYGLDLGTELTGELSWDTNDFLAISALADEVITTDQRLHALKLSITAAGTSFSSYTDFIGLNSSAAVSSFSASADNLVFQGDPYPDWATLSLQSTSPELVPTLCELLQGFSPTLWNQGLIRVGNQSVGGGQSFLYHATVTDVRAVPEVPTWMLLCLFGLIASRLPGRA